MAEPGQALRHGAPCFRRIGDPRHAKSHVIGTVQDCPSCGRYRDHLGVTLPQAQLIRSEGVRDRTDPDSRCPACSWGRRIPNAPSDNC